MYMSKCFQYKYSHHRAQLHSELFHFLPGEGCFLEVGASWLLARPQPSPAPSETALFPRTLRVTFNLCSWQALLLVNTTIGRRSVSQDRVMWLPGRY